MTWLARTELLIGEEKVNKLRNAHVLVVGLGGVGSYAAEFIARAGVGAMTIIDGDTVEASNRNRQLPALCSTEGKWKADVMGERLLDINPDLQLTIIKEFFNGEVSEEVLKTPFDYAVDAIDTLAPKVNFILKAVRNKIPIVSSMGAGAKIDPTGVHITDISKAHGCRLARYLRRRLAKEGIRKGIWTVYSQEDAPKSALQMTEGTKNKRSFYGTVSYIPALFGSFAASVVVRGITGDFPAK